MTSYDALLVVSFGGPEKPDDVLPFLENVTRGRNVPRERLLEVAEHYHRFGGVSPINAQNRELIAAVGEGFGLPIYWGNRNWHPLLEDTLRQMAADGVRRAAAFITAAYCSWSSCRQYLDAIEAARAAVGPGAPEIVPLRHYHDHPGFVEANADRVRDALASLPEDARGEARLVFTAHSIPVSMAGKSPYEAQLRETAALVAAAVGGDRPYDLVWQSRSGPPHIPWLEPDVLDHLEALHAAGTRAVVVAPIGFVSDHMEVVYDLDEEAAALAAKLGMAFARAGTAGTHPAFVRMVRDLAAEPEPAPHAAPAE
ncbi:ferrochelatase [Bailinhaonella thermotolerans]|uniref:Coproporphyrin III ferrochelatase n=1 Tax=Bailinhaonella thermotolerans TaxID=1070861 RepID=A0A3A4BHJ0_9ACTN|nr:ferrochelatase [Bailinhaonella thermotolerans]RJL34262.1 ferrochelatase [Bailinhaonella thermotolerans]